MAKTGRFAIGSKVLFFAGIGVVLLLLMVYSGQMLHAAGEFVVFDEQPVLSDAIVVLNTGVQIYPRLMEAARLYRQGYAGKVVINGNRKSRELKTLEKQGFKPCCRWYENSFRILTLLGVAREDVLAVSAPDAYDTISEAQAVGSFLLSAKLSSAIITTSKYHTRRARYIWQRMFSGRLAIIMAAAQDDPYSPRYWWRDARQIRWVMAEYGAWVYLIITCGL
jgi:uncharacterized SAM-binding protein YcdF (DUF218 family)